MLTQGAEVEVVQAATDSAPMLPVMSPEEVAGRVTMAPLQADLEGTGLPST